MPGWSGPPEPLWVPPLLAVTEQHIVSNEELPDHSGRHRSSRSLRQEVDGTGVRTRGGAIRQAPPLSGRCRASDRRDNDGGRRFLVVPPSELPRIERRDVLCLRVFRCRNDSGRGSNAMERRKDKKRLSGRLSQRGGAHKTDGPLIPAQRLVVDAHRLDEELTEQCRKGSEL